MKPIRNPPQKVHVCSRGEVHKSLLIALISLGAVMVLTLLLFFSAQFVGKAITPAVAGNSVQVTFDSVERDVLVAFSVNRQVNGLYFELQGVDMDLCDTNADITLVDNPANPSYPKWKFAETFCDDTANTFQVSKATVDPSTFLGSTGRTTPMFVKLHLKKFIPSTFSLRLQEVHAMSSAAVATSGFNLFDESTAERYSFTNSAAGTAKTQVTVGQPGAPITTQQPAVTTPQPSPQPKPAAAAGQVIPPVTTRPLVTTQQPLTTAQQNQTAEEAARARDGRGSACVPEWQCGQWGYCNATLQQGRSCTDLKKCSNKPRLEARACAVCDESWTCSAWSSCVQGRQTRRCTDEHRCTTVRSKPPEQQSCVEERPYVPPPVVPPVSPPLRPSTPPAKKSFLELLLLYKWFIIVPLVVLLLVVAVLLFLRRRKAEQKQPEGFNYEELKTWMQQGLRAGLTPEQLWQRLQQETNWTKEEFEKVMGMVSSG